MKQPAPKNLPASVRQRLLNYAREQQHPVNEILSPSDLQAVLVELRAFLLPLLQAGARREPLPQPWRAPGSWDAHDSRSLANRIRLGVYYRLQRIISQGLHAPGRHPLLPLLMHSHLSCFSRFTEPKEHGR